MNCRRGWIRTSSGGSIGRIWSTSTKYREIVPWFSRNYILKMKDAKGSEIPVSRAQTRRLREYLRL